MENRKSEYGTIKIYEAWMGNSLYCIKRTYQSDGKDRPPKTLILLSKRLLPGGSEFSVRVSAAEAAAIIEAPKYRGMTLSEQLVSGQLVNFCLGKSEKRHLAPISAPGTAEPPAPIVENLTIHPT